MATSLKDDVMNVIEQLPQERLAEVLDFALFVKSRAQSSAPQQAVASSVDALAAATHAIDAIEHAEPLYYGQH